MMKPLRSFEYAIIIVGFRNGEEVARCLSSLADLSGPGSISIFICENGGKDAFNDVVTNLFSIEGPCDSTVDAGMINLPLILEGRCGKLRGAKAEVTVLHAAENLGYAGAINACIEILREQPGWAGIWVLNPDALPEPDALAALVQVSLSRKKGMVGSRVMFSNRHDIVDSRGLRWRKVLASTLGVDLGKPADVIPNEDLVEQAIDAPSGASFYVTRSCLDLIGPMDDSYFLYFEDLDWGLRAKAAAGVGYAYNSVVYHVGGTTIGSSRKRSSRSKLAVYLQFRNSLLFVRRNYPDWYLWTIFVTSVRTCEFLLVGAFGNFASAVAGLAAGIKGETGRPPFA